MISLPSINEKLKKKKFVCIVYNNSYCIIGALPGDYLSTDEPDNRATTPEPVIVVAPVNTEEEGEESKENEDEPSIGRITFVSCATGSEDSACLPPNPAATPNSNNSQDNINNGKNTWYTNTIVESVFTFKSRFVCWFDVYW